MLFGSLEFFVFLGIVFALWLAMPPRLRWLVLLAGSYVFYYFWKPWYGIILFIISSFTWYIGISLSDSKNAARMHLSLACGVIANLIPLFVFKYFNFFNDSFRWMFLQVEKAYPVPHLDILLPVGISFYTFQAIAYIVDVYTKKLEAEKHYGRFLLYLAFFPKLISGPIERGCNLLPQLRKPAFFNSVLFISGVQLFIWGLFKKVVLADRMAMYANMVYANPGDFYGQSALLAIWLYSLQIYCDFSAYTDMAIGCGRIFGFELSRNFYFPYFAKSITEFWQRWHITLTSWFRDYVYIPLGGNRVSRVKFTRNIMVVFLVSGLWHGAAWTFVFWGGIHGLLYLLEKTLAPVGAMLKKATGPLHEVITLIQVAITFQLVSFAWVFFRSSSIDDAALLIGNVFSDFSLPIRMMASQFSTYLALCAALFFICSEYVIYLYTKKEGRLQIAVSIYWQIPFWSFTMLAVSLLGMSSNQFIYFHF